MCACVCERKRKSKKINVKNLAILKTDEMHGLDIYQNLAQIVEVGLQRIFPSQESLQVDFLASR